MDGDGTARLRALVDASGLTPGQFATEVMGRVPTTVERWLREDDERRVEIPESAAAWLRRLDSVRVRRNGSIHIIVRPA